MNDLTTRLHALPAKKRALLAQLLKKKAKKESAGEKKSDVSPNPLSRPALREQYDVVILGGGVAGLTLARQIKQARPETTILVVEKRAHPAPQAAFKVGESTIEGGGYYLGEIIGMEKHLRTEQLLKIGLRYFLPAGDNHDIAQRTEVGPFVPLPLPSYQIDRGRFENVLASENLKSGIAFWDASKVEQVSLDSTWHAVTFSHEKEGSHTHYTIKTRWVVDASGRARLLKRQLGLAKAVSHDVNAAWFRVDEPIDVQQWSENPRWRQRMFSGLRRLSTNHLMGAGYWVWLIPLASGSTSIGIVADDTIHPFKQINRRERALSWLKAHEPQCASAISEDKILDFRVLKRYAHSCKHVFSTDRWCITGEAGVFTDPFYSFGFDLIAISNIFITNLIVRELSGEKIEQHVEFYNRFYLDMAFETVLDQYQNQYFFMGNAQVMTAKIVWDFAWYWATLALLIFHPKQLADLDFMLSIKEQLLRFQRLHAEMQDFFRQWASQEQPESSNCYVDYAKIQLMYQLHCDLAAGLTGPALKEQITENLSLLEKAAKIIKAGGRQTAQVEDAESAQLREDLNQIWLGTA